MPSPLAQFTTDAPHPTDPYFSLDDALDIAIEIAPADWDTMRHQTRTLEDVFEEIETNCLSEPFAGIYSWFSATVTVDGETHTDVGVRKKGFVGSQSDVKPALKVRFDKYVDDQRLGGILERMTLNNGIQGKSFINTCMAYRLFAAAGLPAPRCNFANVAVNGEDLGLYIHVEDLKTSMLERTFDNPDGNLYEGTISDFRPGWRGTFEKKTNEDADDWSDIDAVVEALQDPTPAGLAALDAAVDRDRFLSFWAMEVLAAHWDGYTGNRNNYHFYREPNGPFVFIPWGVDSVLYYWEDPNYFDGISDPPTSVMASGAIANRLYLDEAGRDAYVNRLRELLDTVWNEEELLQLVDTMAAVVQDNALPKNRESLAEGIDEVREFIQQRRQEILDGLEPEPPDWPWALAPPPCSPDAVGFAGDTPPGSIDIDFTTLWGSHDIPNPWAAGKATRLLLDEVEQSAEDTAVTAGAARPSESDLPGMASINAFSIEQDGSVTGLTLVLPIALLTDGATLTINEDDLEGGVWSIPPGAEAPDWFTPFTAGRLELDTAGTEARAIISARFSGAWGGPSSTAANGDAVQAGLVINEVAAAGDPLDWFELYNPTEDYVALANFVVADDLKDAGKRVAFPADLVLPPGGYLQVQVDKDGWPGFGLGGDEELGLWTAGGSLVDSIDWDEGESPDGGSLARMPDGSGAFQTVSDPTPGASNQP